MQIRTKTSASEEPEQTDSQNSAPAAPPEKLAAIVNKTSTLIGWVLQIGVLVSALVILIGVVMLFLSPGGLSPDKFLTFPHSFSAVGAGLLALRPQSVIVLGLLLLIATPVMRVAVSIVAFALEHDRDYVVITLIVLIILLCSLFLLGGIAPMQGHSLFTQGHYSPLIFVAIFAGAIAAGLLGSLVGLGGGVLIVPLLTLVFGFPIYFAIGASIISVIATSSGAAAAYVKDHMTNMRVGMFLELATTTGAICGAFLAGLLAPNILSLVFGVILLVSVAPLIVKIGEELPKGVKNDFLAQKLNLGSSYPDKHLGQTITYQVRRTPLGLVMMYVAGLISGLLGIGSGTFKVLAMDVAMRLPMKVSTTTSNFMIGVTAAASAGIYFSRGDISPLIAAPVALGILIGALVGARLLEHLSNKMLRIIFIPVIVVAAVEMILHAFGIA
ncbi:MAG TPA: TSUP family transporter [Ktedonobacteraceae bacterium]|nr:TSUP family transporter [Ktedonobacteraceae bacterium]